VMQPDYHMFIQGDFYQADPDVMVHVMTQLSFKSIWSDGAGDKAYAVVTSEMKQLHFWNIQTKALEWAVKDSAATRQC
jgi:hypothetical protein